MPKREVPPDARVVIEVSAELGGLINSVRVVDDPSGLFDDFIPRLAIVLGDTPHGPAGAHFLAGQDRMSVQEINTRIVLWGKVLEQKLEAGDYNQFHEPSDEERKGPATDAS